MTAIWKCESSFRNSHSSPRNKQNHVQKISGCCVLPRFLSTLPMGFSFVYHMLPSSLPLSTVVLQHKMKGPGRPPRCHLPPQFLMRHLSYTNRFQCLIKTIHFLPHASCWKNTVSKPPFLYQLWIFIEFNTLINSPWVKAETPRIGSKRFEQRRQLSLALSPLVFSLGALKVSRFAYNIRCGYSEASRRLLRSQLSCIHCTSAISMHASYLPDKMGHVMSCHVMLCHAVEWNYHIMIHCVAVHKNHRLCVFVTLCVLWTFPEQTLMWWSWIFSTSIFLPVHH